MAGHTRILVVDDSPTNRTILVRSLERIGCAVLTACDGFEGVETATRECPDLILMDVMMPGRDGLDACRILKNQARTASIPIIFVTAVSEPDQIVKALQAGGCDYVKKPFRMEEVLARVSVHMRLHEAERALRRKNEEMEELTCELAKANVELVNLTRYDPLTGQLNRRTWEEAVSQEYDRFLRGGGAFSIVMLDVDHFKSFNDSQGHQAGDACLRRVASAIAQSCRHMDVVGRYGGEEFVIMAPDTPCEAAVGLAERVRKAVWALGIPHGKSTTAARVTISAGVAACDQGTWEETLKQADDALYVAKRTGRNTVCTADDSTNVGSALPLQNGGGSVDGRTTVDTQIAAHVLIVGAEPANRTACKRCLERAGYVVNLADHVDEAMALIGHSPPDVIVTDATGPHADGLASTRRFKANANAQEIPIILIGAPSSGGGILAGLEAGADECLTQPIRDNELVLRVRSMARQHLDRRDLLMSFRIRGEHLRILRRLVDYCRDIGASDSLDDILGHTVTAAADVLRCTRCAIMLPDFEDGTLRIAKSAGMNERAADLITVPVAEPIAGQAFSMGRQCVINVVTETPPDEHARDAAFFDMAPLIAAPLQVAQATIGVLNVTGRLDQTPFAPHELEYMELLASLAAGGIHDVLTRTTQAAATNATMVALAKLAEHRDKDSSNHVDRVARYCCMLAEELRETDTANSAIDDTFLRHLELSAPLHDIGKIAIPDSILRVPGKLSTEQMEIMRTHAAIGAGTIQTIIDRTTGIGFLDMAADIARHHHEWYDGTGYPDGLKGDAIPLAARIAALADVYDALTTKRVYKEAYTHDKAMAIIVESCGTQFDPRIVEGFVRRESDFARLSQSMRDEPVQPDPATAVTHQ